MREQRAIRYWLMVPVVALALAGCSSPTVENTDSNAGDTQSDTATDTTTDSVSSDPNSLTSILPSSVNTNVTTNLNLASNAAKEWQSDAVLAYVSVELPASLAPNSGNEVYVFGSAADSANWWTYSISQDTGKFVRAVIPKEDFLGADLDPVNTEYWNMNYVEALQLAERNGGTEFRASNNGTRMTIFLSQRAPRGWLWWTVEYNAPSGEQLSLLVNPNRGEVVDETGTEIAPPEDSTSSDGSSETDASTDTETLSS